jgi:dGTPase
MFENRFYSDADCRFVKFRGLKVDWTNFVRDNWNKSNAHRTPFQRDLDRLVFSGPFRRLQGKTQVRRTGPKCYSRTRLSHSMEVARIAHSLVNRLYFLTLPKPESFVDLDLVEFACYAHDIGNPPFGHAGERELNACMGYHGGFEGNAQSLRIITEIGWSRRAKTNPTRIGIEPTQAAVESILKNQELHHDKKGPPKQRSKFLYDYQGQLIETLSIANSQSLECQIMDIADDIANALIDYADGIRAGIINEDTLNEQKNAGYLDKSIMNRLRRTLKYDSKMGMQSGRLENA